MLHLSFRAGVAKWWERSPPTNVSRVRFPDPASYVPVEFDGGSRPCSEGLSPGSPVFLPPQKSTFVNSNSMGNARAEGLSVEDCFVPYSLNKVDLIFSTNDFVDSCEAPPKLWNSLCAVFQTKGTIRLKFGRKQIYFQQSQMRIRILMDL